MKSPALATTVANGRESRRLSRGPQNWTSTRQISALTGAHKKTGCACGGSCPRCRPALPAQLDVSRPGDRHEQEADHTAERVLRMSAGSTDPLDPLSSTATHAQAKTEDPATTTRDGGYAALNLGAGHALADSARAFFEPRFGRGFGAVRVHTDAGAQAVAGDFGARALTVGRDIVFNRGEYSPDSTAGRRLLAHELTHVVQQTQSASRRGISRARRQIMRTTYVGCDKATTGIADSAVAVDAARALAATTVKTARATFKPFTSAAIKSADQHFHCPSTTQVMEVMKIFGKIEAALPNVIVTCLAASDTTCSSGGRGNVDTKGNGVNFCPMFFAAGTPDSIRALIFIAGAALLAGPKTVCWRGDACYGDFTQPASAMLDNPYSYAWFAVEAAGLSPPVAGIIPCRPLEIGINVVVPPEARTDPTKIRRLNGYDPIPPGSEIVPVYVDSGGKYFIYRNDLPGSRVYTADEAKKNDGGESNQKRYYFPQGRP